jgi:hypothetical protein
MIPAYYMKGSRKGDSVKRIIGRTNRSLIALLMLGVASIGLAMQQSTANLTQTVQKATPTVTVTSSSLTSSFGQSVTFTATLSSPLGSKATGTIQFMDGSIALGSPMPLVGSGTNVMIATATLPTSALPASATNSITAVYSGDSNFVGTTSAAITENVTQAVPGQNGIAPVTLASAPNPSIYQNAVTFTATVPALATGSVSFVDNTNSSAPVTLGTTQIVIGTPITFTTNALTAETHAINAVYSGDPNFTVASSTPADSQVVHQAPTITTLTASPAANVAVGQSVTLTALVNTGVLTPTGTITFANNGTNLPLGAVAVTQATATNLLPFSANFSSWTGIHSTGIAVPTVGAAVLGPDGASGSATTVSFPATTTGTFSGLQLTAAAGNYAGKSMTVSFWAQSTTATQLTVNLTDGSGGNIVTSAANAIASTGTWQRFVVPLMLSSSAAPGAIVSINSVNQAAGSVNLFGAQLEQAPTAGVYVLTNGASASGFGAVATYTTTALLEGSNALTAVYAGDTNFTTSTGALNLAVGSGTPTVTVISSLPSSNYGQSVTFTANVAEAGAGATPTGTVQFLDGATVIGTQTLASGQASFPITMLTAGTHQITVQYAGDTNFSSATSAAITQTVAQVSATVAANSTVNPSSFGQQTILGITLTGVTGGLTPTGTVTVTDTSVTPAVSLGTVNLLNGTASLPINTLTVGSHSLVFTYNGDTNYK